MIAFAILSHKDPSQLLRLIRVLKAGMPDSWIVVHHDQGFTRLDPEIFEPFERVHLLKDWSRVELNSFSRVEPILKCLRWLLNNAREIKWVMVLSGQDYPIKPLWWIEEWFRQTDYDLLMCYHDALDHEYWGEKEGYYRYFFSWRTITIPRTFWRIQRLIPFLKKINNYKIGVQIRGPFADQSIKIGLRHPFTIFSSDFHCYRGSDWFSLSHRCIEYLFDFLNSNTKVLSYYKQTHVPSESFFQTIFINAGKFKVLNDNMRFIEWAHPSSYHPEILTTDRFKRLLHSSKHFARKFDSKISGSLLDLIDEQILTGSPPLPPNQI